MSVMQVEERKSDFDAAKSELRVCFVVNNLSYGGAERQVTSLATEHVRRGNRVDVITLLPNLAFTPELQRAEVNVHELDFTQLGPAGTIRALRALVDRLNPDIVHSHLYHSNLACRVAIRGAHPLICTLHNSAQKVWTRYIAYRLTERWGDLTTIVSQQGVNAYLRYTKTRRKDQVRVCKNGLQPGRWHLAHEQRASLRESLDITSEFVWITVGRHRPQKGFPLLIDAFADHLKHCRKALLLMVGDGPDRRGLEIQAERRYVSDRVRFLGNRDDVANLFAVADAHVMSSRIEGLPVVLLEASCAGIYSVVTDVGANSEVLENGRLGSLVPAGSSTALAKAMNEVTDLTQQCLAEKGSAVRESVERRYSIEAVVEEWNHMYREVLASRR